MSVQQDLFKTLVNKLRLDDSSDQKYLQKGAITDLVIHDRSNVWSFYISLDSIMPYPIFVKFNQRLQKDLGKTSFNMHFKVSNPKVTGSLIKNYWSWVVHNCGLSTLMLHQLIKDGHLKLVDNQALLGTKDEALRGFLINGALVQIEDLYHQLGFPRFHIKVLGGKSKLPAKIVDFQIKKNSDDIKLARVAAKSLDKDSAR